MVEKLAKLHHHQTDIVIWQTLIDHDTQRDGSSRWSNSWDPNTLMIKRNNNKWLIQVKSNILILTILVADTLQTLKNGRSLAVWWIRQTVAASIRRTKEVRDRVRERTVLCKRIDCTLSQARLENVDITASTQMVYGIVRLLTSSSSCTIRLLVDVSFPTDYINQGNMFSTRSKFKTQLLTVIRSKGLHFKPAVHRFWAVQVEIQHPIVVSKTSYRKS